MSNAKEYLDIIEGLKARLELMQSSGIYDLPFDAAPACAPPAQGSSCGNGWVNTEARGQELKGRQACALHKGWKGVFFGIWRVGNSSFVWGVPASGTSLDTPFNAAESGQLERMLNWLGGELGIKADIKDLFAVSSVLCLPAEGYKDTDAVRNCLPGLERAVVASPGVVVAMGPLSAWALLESPGVKEARGRVHEYKGAKLVVTYDPGELLLRPELKKEAFDDMKLVLRELR